MIKRINCNIATCARCQNHIFVRKGLWGHNLYICPYYPKKHIEIEAQNCGYFKCGEYNDSKRCTECNKGEYKTLTKTMK